LSLLRGGRLAPQPGEVAKYTASVAYDVHIADEVVKVNIAHVVMLAERGLIDKSRASIILGALLSAKPGELLDETLEDVHMNLERWVTEKVGAEAAGWMHLAKSRNDQVAAAIRMKLREKLIEAGLALIALRRALLSQSRAHLYTVMPGYTHLQRAQPITLALHLLAHHDALARDTERLKECYVRVNQSPMGAAALAGSSIPVDRRRVAELLGFEGLVEDTVDAVSARDFLVEALAAASLVMNHVSRLCEEMVLWSSSEFGFVEIADEYSSTSSIMPQKKNPVVAEVARARAYRVYGDLLAALSMTARLPLSYNLDLQEVTPHLWDAYDILISTLRVVAGMVSTATFNPTKMEEALSDGYVNATELANMLVKKGLSFRQAHHAVGLLVRRLLEQGRTLTSLTPSELVEAVREVSGKEVVVGAEELKLALNPRWTVEACQVEGGPSPSRVKVMIDERVKKASLDEKYFTSLKSKLEEAYDKLMEAVKVIASSGGG